jgi:EAL domain-containing protein (putative c-di-GMP-specific phosphodiesterase class I)
VQRLDGLNCQVGTLVKAIIALGPELNRRAAVKGAETASQAAYFDTANSDQGRGIFLGASILVKLHVVSAAAER